MKKTLIALAAVNLVGAAAAQSVTIYGTVDTAVSYYRNESISGVKSSQTALSNSGLGVSKLGFRGTEDLGGGLSASFWLEGTINSDTGGGTGTSGLTFDRRSTVSFSGPFGEVRLGRDYTPTVWNDVIYDPFLTIGSGGSLLLFANTPFNNNGIAGSGGNNYIRASNSVSYFLPANLGGFFGQVMYSFPETNKFSPGVYTPDVANTQRTGRYVGGRVGYRQGNFDIAGALSENTIGDNYFAGTTTAVDNFNIGSSYNFGFIKLMAEYTASKAQVDYAVTPASAIPDIDLTGYMLAATMPVGPGLIRGSYAQVKYDFNNPARSNPSATKWALGYVYYLSKRTAMYATAARVDNKNGGNMNVWGLFTAQPKNSSGYDFGIKHDF